MIDERRAKVITGELGGQDRQVRRRVEAAVLPGASTMDTVALRRRITQLLHELAPVSTQQRCQAARERRDVTITAAPDAMAYLEAHLPAEDAIAVKTVLDAAAHTLKRHDTTAGHQPRTAAQRRADALAALAWTTLHTQTIAPTGSDHAADTGAGAGRGGAAPIPLASAQGRPVTVHVTVPLRSLIGLTDEPGHLDGYGPIPAHTARHLAADGIWQW
ncbi:DUF222 domain-containing protein, partial [Jiangella asiatica]